MRPARHGTHVGLINWLRTWAISQWSLNLWPRRVGLVWLVSPLVKWPAILTDRDVEFHNNHDSCGLLYLKGLRALCSSIQRTEQSHWVCKIYLTGECKVILASSQIPSMWGVPYSSTWSWKTAKRMSQRSNLWLLFIPFWWYSWVLLSAPKAILVLGKISKPL